MMECPYCKGTMKRDAAPFSMDRKGYQIHWDAVPAWVCTQCGESVFEEREVDAMQRALLQVDKETESLIKSA
jgi:YgiT-type zinc finger domain-containing protein